MYTFEELTYSEFDNFARNYPECAFVQSEKMALLQQTQNRRVKTVGVKYDGKLIAAGLFSIRPVILTYSIAHCNQGPLIDFNNKELVKFFFQNVKELLKKEKCLHVLITPNFPVYLRDIDAEIIGNTNNLAFIENLEKANVKHRGFDNSPINGIGRWLFMKDFSDLLSVDDLMNSFDHPTRKAIRKTIKDQIEVIEIEEDEMHIFKELMEKTSQRRDFKDRPLNYYQSLKRVFKDDCKVLVAKLNVENYSDSIHQQYKQVEYEVNELQHQIETTNVSKKIVNKHRVACENLAVLKKRKEELVLFTNRKEVTLGGVIYIVYGNELTALFAGNDDKYFGFNGTHAIHYYAMSKAVELKLQRFNFYGTAGKFSGSNDEGVYKFKKGFGGYVLEQPGDFELEVLPLLNKMYNLIHKIKNRK